MQGKACEFVYGQLSSTTRRKFTALVDEIQYRFRKVESSRTYSLKFSNRTQKTGETAEDFAAEPKKYYDKVYPKRDRETRREDLLRRFFDGMNSRSVCWIPSRIC